MLEARHEFAVRAAPSAALLGALGIALLGIALLFRETFASLFRVWTESDTFAHCFVIAPISLFLIWRRRDALREAPKTPSSLGLVAVLVLSVAGGDPNRRRALMDAGAEVIDLRGADRRHLHLREVQRWLWEQGYRRVLLEAGPTLVSAMLDAGFVDQVRVYTGDVRGGRGESLGQRLASARLMERADRERGMDSVLEAFLPGE